MRCSSGTERVHNIWMEKFIGVLYSLAPSDVWCRNSYIHEHGHRILFTSSKFKWIRNFLNLKHALIVCRKSDYLASSQLALIHTLIWAIQLVLICHSNCSNPANQFDKPILIDVHRPQLFMLIQDLPLWKNEHTHNVTNSLASPMCRITIVDVLMWYVNETRNCVAWANNRWFGVSAWWPALNGNAIHEYVRKVSTFGCEAWNIHTVVVGSLSVLHTRFVGAREWVGSCSYSDNYWNRISGVVAAVGRFICSNSAEIISSCGRRSSNCCELCCKINHG